MKVYIYVIHFIHAWLTPVLLQTTLIQSTYVHMYILCSISHHHTSRVGLYYVRSKLVYTQYTEVTQQKVPYRGKI